MNAVEFKQSRDFNVRKEKERNSKMSLITSIFIERQFMFDQSALGMLNFVTMYRYCPLTLYHVGRGSHQISITLTVGTSTGTEIMD